MKRSFTLIEILVVVSIIGLFGTVGMSSFSTTNRNASDIRRKSDLESIKPKLSIYYQTKGTYPASLSFGSSLVEDGNTYIDNIPQDPKSSDGYTYYYSTTSDGSFVLCTRLENNSDVNDIASTTCKTDGTKCNYCATMTGNYLAENSASNPMNATSLRNLTCTGVCTGKCEGDSDGCNGTCPLSCPSSDYQCRAGSSTPTCCKADCTGKCGGGPDGCNMGGTCAGTCQEGFSCINYSCDRDFPVGGITFILSSTPPSGFIECNGQSTSAYPALAAVIGANVPDLRDQFIRVLDSRKRTVGSIEAEELKGHNHIYGDNGVNAAWGSSSMVADHGNHASRVWSANPYTSTTGGTETRPKNIALMAIIKY